MTRLQLQTAHKPEPGSTDKQKPGSQHQKGYPMTNIFGTEHEPTTYKHPSGDMEQHSFHLGNDVAFSAVRSADLGGGA